MSSLDNWDKAEPHILAALVNCGNTHAPSDVRRMIKEGTAALFVGEDSAIVTQEIDTPTGRLLHFWLAGGELEELAEMSASIETAAKAKGISRVSIVGRRGWQKALPGYREAGVILMKEI